MLTLQELPLEVIHDIIHFVDTFDLVALGQLNRWWSAQVYDVCHKRMQEVMQDGWTIMIILESVDPERGGEYPTLEDSFSLVAVLDRIEPLTFDMVFNLHEIAENGRTEAPLQADTKSSIAVYGDATGVITIVATFVGRDLERDRLVWIDQLEPIHFVPGDFHLSPQSSASKQGMATACVPPSFEAYISYTLLRKPKDSVPGITKVNREYLTRLRSIHEDEDPYVLRLDNFVCDLKWWLSKVQEAQTGLSYPGTDQMNIW